MTTGDRGALRGGDPSPVRVHGMGPAVLALHGYGGTPFEVRLVVEVAQELGGDTADAEGRATHRGYGLQPIRGACEVLRGGERTLELLPRVTVPAFIAHGAHDHVCPVANAENVARLLGSRDKTVLILRR